jgi:hypothetical protein
VILGCTKHTVCRKSVLIAGILSFASAAVPRIDFGTTKITFVQDTRCFSIRFVIRQNDDHIVNI